MAQEKVEGPGTSALAMLSSLVAGMDESGRSGRPRCLGNMYTVELDLMAVEFQTIQE